MCGERPVDGCVDCESFAHQNCFTHDAIWDLSAFVSADTRSGDLCQYTYHELAYYVGLDEPRYPVPAIPIKVGFHPYSHMPDRAPYIYVHLWQRVLWTFFKGWGIVIERNE